MSYSAGEFVRDASEAMHQIWQRGRQPLLVGGTMLYFHALTSGLAQLPEADCGVRAQIDAQAASEGMGGRYIEELAASRSGSGRANSRQRSPAHSTRARGVPSDR